MREITRIKCDKCGCTNVVDEAEEELKISVRTTEEYIKKHQSTSIFDPSINVGFTGVSHMEKRKLRCPDCGHTILYDQVVYT